MGAPPHANFILAGRQTKLLSIEAIHLRMEEKIGSIEPGKLADLVVLDRDYFAVPDSDIKKIRSLLTIVGGNVVHNAGALG